MSPKSRRKQTSKEKREAFFQRGVEAYTRISTETGEIYPCPICARGFDRDALDRRLLTLEHVPPQSMGGKPVCLTCKECNNTAGHAFEFAPAQLQKVIKLAEALGQGKGKFEGPLTMTVDGHAVRGSATIDEGGVKFRVIEENNSPADLAAQHRHMQKLVEEGSTGIEYKLSTTFKATPRQVFLSNLRAAFLSAFAILGYRYALHPSLEIVRRQILEPEKEIIPQVASGKFEGGEDAPVPMVYYMDKPVEGIVVRLPSTMVVLPFPNLPVDDFYSTLTALCGPDGKLAMHLESIGWPVGPELRLDFEGRK